jgi:hypothetical protein
MYNSVPKSVRSYIGKNITNDEKYGKSRHIFVQILRPTNCARLLKVHNFLIFFTDFY